MEWSDLKFIGIAFLAILAIVVMFYIVSIIGEQGHIANDKIYACPKGDWSGYTKDMNMVSDGDGRRNYYCPIDGAWIGWENDRDPLPIGGN